MRLIRGFVELGFDGASPAVTIGNFDGVHRGHQDVILSARDEARRRGVEAVVCTFDPHTMKILRPDSAPRLLQTLEQRLEAFSALEIDVTIVIPFDQVVARTGHRSFVDEFLVRQLHVGSLHVSTGFFFGRDRAGSTAYLERRAQECGFRVLRVPALQVGGVPVSATRIRELIESGQIGEANALLTRPYALSGAVVHGAGRGHGLSAPTANLAVQNGCLPASGVYVGQVRHGDGVHRAVANIGNRPTFDRGSARVIEAHLLNFTGDLYGEQIELELLERLRAERQFDSPQALAEQIQADIRRAHQVFEQLGATSTDRASTQ